MESIRLWRTIILVGVLVTAIGVIASADISLRVYDNGDNHDDDIARVYVDGQNLGLITFNSGGTNEKTFYLNITSVGTHTLVIEHAIDEDATTLCDEHAGTYGITFGGGGLSASNDSATASRGASAEINVLANDIYVSAAATATDSIPCPSEDPAPTTNPSCACNETRTTYDTTFEIFDGADELTINRFTVQPNKGHAEIIPGGKLVRYTPNPDGCGIDSFTYEVSGPNGSTDTATVTVSIQSTTPSSMDDEAETAESQQVLIDVLNNDSDPGGGTLTLNSVGSPTYGSATIVGDRVRYTPRARFEGNDRFSYTVRDACGATATAWVEIDVLHTNHPPEASAGMMYRGVVGEPVVLNALFSHDPDIEDILQYRWDLDGDGTADTGWSNNPQYEAIFSDPFFGRIILEVRDLYRGIPSGEISEATALVRIASLQSIQVFVFEDLDGNGIMDSGEPGLPGINVTIDGDQLTTEADGGISIELDAGRWDIAMTAQSISQLESRGFAVLETETTVDLGTGAIETVGLGIVKTLTNFKGFVYVDLDENGEFNEDTDQLLQGLRVILDEDQETLTDDGGRFFFLSIPFGEHTLWIGENVEQTEGTDAEDILSLTIPFILERGASNEFEILWPWVPAGPGQGFLRVDVEKSEGN